MSLIENFKTPCVLLEKHKEEDGEGGFISEWRESAKFEAAIGFDNTLEARIAEKQGITSVYTVTTSKNAVLEYHDVFKRLSDGKIFRVTSDGEDVLSPEVSSLDMSQVTAEEWRLPT